MPTIGDFTAPGWLLRSASDFGSAAGVAAAGAAATGAATGAGADPMAFTSDWHRMMIENFMAHLQQGEKLIASARSALAVHQLIDAIEDLSSLER